MKKKSNDSKGDSERDESTESHSFQEHETYPTLSYLKSHPHFMFKIRFSFPSYLEREKKEGRDVHAPQHNHGD